MSLAASGEFSLHGIEHIGGAAAARPLVRPLWLERILAATLVFNLLDVVFTLLVVLGGFAVEANPVMAHVLDAGPVPFALAKLTVVSLGVFVLWRERKRRLAVLGSLSVFGIYAALMVYHLQSLQVLLGG